MCERSKAAKFSRILAARFHVEFIGLSAVTDLFCTYSTTINGIRQMAKIASTGTIAALVALSLTHSIDAADVALLTPKTWDKYVPQGKEVDAIYGDLVIRNSRITAVLARPLESRNANMTVRGTGGMLIDLTQRSAQNDQLSAYYAAAEHGPFSKTAKVTVDGKSQDVNLESFDPNSKLELSGKLITIQFSTAATGRIPAIDFSYRLMEGAPFVDISTKYKNGKDEPTKFALTDAIRADRTFEFEERGGLFSASDEWFHQAYGVLIDGRKAVKQGRRILELRDDNDSAQVEIAAGESLTIGRKVFPAGNLIELRGIARQLTKQQATPVSVRVFDRVGPIKDARVTIAQNGNTVGVARTTKSGRIAFAIPHGEFQMTVESLGRVTRSISGNSVRTSRYDVSMEMPGYVRANITGEDGGKIPCKVAFAGKEGTKTPHFGPDSRAVAIHNLYYSHTGHFEQELAPGDYDVIISRGPEYDAIFTEINVERGKVTKLDATLVRTVDTKGWVSSDFHSHSTPSGDNTSMQLGRVLNLVCEHVEFAPCTEHNRVSTYSPHLKKLGVEHLMATCIGMELTGTNGRVNHQNAFPLKRTPRIQDAGAPLRDANPIAQIERLAMWDDNSDKLIQMNHPTLPQILGDKDGDGNPDEGFEKMFGYVDVIEVHPPAAIFKKPTDLQDSYKTRNPIFHWMQMLNMGYRIPGVVNTDAHYNYHGSGWIRNWMKASTDDPDKIKTDEMVRTSEGGHIIMSTGPFLEVTIATNQAKAIPGDDLSAPDGDADATVRVQCSNWFDINRVQFFLNGKPDDRYNFTRRTTPDKFGNKVVKFEATIPLKLTTDTHVIVAAIGEGLQIGPVMGENFGKQTPVAVSNPIFIDVDGDGFKPNQDDLGLPLPKNAPAAN